MKITITKIEKELEKNYGWKNISTDENKYFIRQLIKDVLKIVTTEPNTHK